MPCRRKRKKKKEKEIKKIALESETQSKKPLKKSKELK